MAKPGAKRKPSTRKISERKKPALRAVPAAVPSDHLDPRELDRLKAELAAARVQIAELEVRADIDPLLNILNRRGFERELARSLAYVKRYGTDAVLLYIDLDDFKSVNDSHGHATGDELLKAVTAALMSQVRASDVIGRLGGDEFAVVLWNMSVTHAGGKARALEESDCRCDDHTRPGKTRSRRLCRARGAVAARYARAGDRCRRPGDVHAQARETGGLCLGRHMTRRATRWRGSRSAPTGRHTVVVDLNPESFGQPRPSRRR